MKKIIIDKEGCKVIHIENFLDEEEQKELYKTVKKINFKQEVIKMFNKTIQAPRETFSYGDKGLTYTYARKTEECVEWTEYLKGLRDSVFNMSKECGDGDDPFNFVLLNYYKDNTQYIGAHSDNERDILPESVIASLSLGSQRKFRFIHKETKEKTVVELKSGSLLLMMGKTQEVFKHELPKTMVKCGERYNLTFRHLRNK